ncbi:MAG: hypothetical protein U0835_17005 [Isosphaeraceae bacterium]
MQGDQAYDSEHHRQGRTHLRVELILPEKGAEDQSRRGEHSRPAEWTTAWFHQNRRLRVRHERRG